MLNSIYIQEILISTVKSEYFDLLKDFISLELVKSEITILGIMFVL